MKKIIFLILVTASQRAFAMSLYQHEIRKALSPEMMRWYSSIPKHLWLLENIVACTDGNHQACNKMRVYFEKYAAIACNQIDSQWTGRSEVCDLVYKSLLDKQFMEQLMKDHRATQSEAESCAQVLASISE